MPKSTDLASDDVLFLDRIGMIDLHTSRVLGWTKGLDFNKQGFADHHADVYWSPDERSVLISAGHGHYNGLSMLFLDASGKVRGGKLAVPTGREQAKITRLGIRKSKLRMFATWLDDASWKTPTEATIVLAMAWNIRPAQ